MASADPTDKPDDQVAAATAHGGEDDTSVTNTTTTTTTATTTTAIPTAAVTEDDESDWEELDEVLDDFNKPKEPENAPSATSGPGRPESTPTAAAAAVSSTAPVAGDFDEEALLKQLEAEMMANFMGGGSAGGATGAGLGTDGIANTRNADDTQANEFIDKEIDELSKQLKDSGIEPESFLKSLIAESLLPGDPKDGNDTGFGASAGAAPENIDSAAAGTNPAARGSFQDTIRRTMERMQESGDRATAAAAEDDVPEDLLAQLLKVVEAGASAGGENMDLNKMFMGMMEQLSNKEMLYEPMKELHTKFGPWLAQNKDIVSVEDLTRYETQARVVGEIVAKFDEEGFSDDKPECRTFIWDRMQEMQAAGSPPDDLISNPLMDELKGTEGTGEGQAPPDCPQQ